MAKHAFAVYGLKVAPRMHPENKVDVANIDGNGLSVAHLARGFLASIRDSPFTDDRYQQYFSVNDISPAGQQVRFTAGYGGYGQEGEMINVKNHETTHKFARDESATVLSRNMLVVPDKGDTALYFAERYGGRGSASFFLRQMKAAFRRRMLNEQLILHHESLIDHQAWSEYLQRAKLTGVQVVRYGISSDIAEGVSADVVGRLRYEVKPRRGAAGLGQRLKDLLLSKEVKAQQILGLSAELEKDETRLDLDDGNQQRQLIIGREEPPALAYLIPYKGDGRPTDDVVFGAMERVVPVLMQQLGMEISSNWNKGAWSADQLNVRMGAVRGD
ncbi:hypothetical protein [Micromonospora fluostatini]|uniref:hypothetical protein n=1 Tax=Micromonospora sp. JCM 30529 TaxID=3421643 RepID=UPI003D18423F